MVPRPYWIVGPGRVGLSLGSVLAEAKGATELLFVGRRVSQPDHPVMSLALARYESGFPGPPPPETRLLLAVPDGAIGAVAVVIAGLGAPGAGCVAFHFSGAQSAEVLAPLAELGYATGSLHPLQTVADPLHGGQRLHNAFFTFEGDPEAKEAATEIVDAAGGRMLEVHASDKARYHAACVFASNYLVTCAAVATRTLAEAVNVSQQEAARALQPLWRGAIANLEELGLPRALTGPVARGDVDTVRRHLTALDDEDLQLYRHLARQALAMGRELGLDAEAAEAIEQAIAGADGGGTKRR